MPRILVADDNPLSLRFFGDALAAFEVDCTPAADGLVALELAAREAFDLLLLDARMPGAGAIEVLAVIRAGTGPSRHAPALATTAASGDGAQVALRAAGFADVLTKPLPIAALRGALDTWLPAWRPHVVSEPRAAWLDDVRAMTVAGGDAAVVPGPGAPRATNASMSFRVTRPPTPDPCTAPSSTWCSCASRITAGE